MLHHILRHWRAISLAVVVATAGCDEGPLLSPSVLGEPWRLESIERVGDPIIRIANPSDYTVRFEPDGRLAVRADCNTCSGRYTLSGERLTTSAVACTRAFCGTNNDTAFATALSDAQTATLDGSALILRGASVVVRLRR